MTEKLISRATRSQRAALVETLSAAFQDDPALSWIITDPNERRRRLPYFFGSIVRGCMANGVVLCSETVEAVTLWRTPGKIHPGWIENLISLPGLSRAIGKDWKRAMIVSKSLHDHHPDFRHYYLQFAGVAPEFQGKGWGGTTIRAGLEIATAAGAPSYLETAKESNVGLYQRLGFEIVQEWDVPSDGPHFWGMLKK